MGNWKTIHLEGLEGEHYDQEAKEVSLPRGYRLFFITSKERHDYKRPEMAFKEKALNHPQVHTGAFSGVGFHVFTKFSWYLVSRPIEVKPGHITRAKATVMIEAHGIEGDLTRPGACGMRVGIMDADAITLRDQDGNPVEDDDLSRTVQEEEAYARRFIWDRISEQVTPQILAAEDDIAWSLWWVVRDNLENEHKWVTLQSDKPPPEDGPQPPFKPKGNKVRLILQCNADVAAAISAGHYDQLFIEQEADGDVEEEVPAQPTASGLSASVADLESSLENFASGLPHNLGGASTAEKVRLIEIATNLQKLSKLLAELAQ